MVSYIPLFMLLALRAAADTDSIIPTNNPLPQEAGQLVLKWAGMSVDIAPLTSGAGQGQSATSMTQIHPEGNLTIPTDFGKNTQTSQIVYLSCDPDDSSDLNNNSTFTTAATIKPQAILLYSLTSNACNLHEVSDYTDVFTMTSLESSKTVFNVLNSTSTTPSLARIIDQSVAATNTTGPDSTPTGISSSTPGENQDGTPAPTTAVAMSILYSITGIITLLFLIIIATGAIRAHRHPERYGPRNGFPGRPRQSRAKGLARAMLETLPIVKFGDPEPDKPGRDIELERANSHTNNPEAMVAAGGREDGESRKSGEAAQQEGGLGPNQTPSVGEGEASGSSDDHLGCSICTEDFTRGEDVRVLPCNHKYHPACIDPWLLNVSGTCPLCRVDLRPVQSNTSELPRAEDFEEPIVVAEAGEADTAGMEHSTAAPSATRRRVSRLLDFNRLRHAEPEERIAALRRLRTQDRSESTEPAAINAEESGVEVTTANNGSTVGSEERERNRRSRFSRTIRAAFDIRTTVASGSTNSNPSPSQVEDASMVGGRGT